MTDRPTMTPEKATALRKPFPPESIGKLPKPLKGRDDDRGKCQPGTKYSADGYHCGGWHARAMHLDFVGHAATTDRLLTVDPEWSWDFLAYTTDGLPVTKDSEGNLWIKLTICGVTRIGVGDGSSAKERIGDAIRNAAMRFGVALDLWAKEALVEFAQAAQAHQAEPEPADPVKAVRHEARREARQPQPAPDLEPDTGEAIRDNTRKRLFALMGELVGTDEATQRAFLTDTLGRDVDSRASLTEAEGVNAGQRLAAWKRGEAGAAWQWSDGDR